jgi:arginine N-succinyltransferase
MIVLRPCRLADLSAVEAIAAASAVGITSLPPDHDRLREKIANSMHSLAAEVDVCGEESYFFVLENITTGEVIGTSGIVASAGFHDRFYSYRNEIIVHASQQLGVSNKIHSLHLCHDLTGLALLSSFFIKPEHQDGALPQLLSRARLLFMAEHANRFPDRIAAESPGVCDDEGNSPFWNAVGKRFFNMGYPQAEQLSGGRSKTFIAELMPQYPIYVPLLPADAKLAIGQLHPVGELPFSILMDEGFEADTYIDIFDGGPTVDARISGLRSVMNNIKKRAIAGDTSVTSKLHVATQAAARVPSLGTPVGQQALENAQLCIVANTETEGFRATLANVAAGLGDTVVLSEEMMAALEIVNGDDVRIVPVHFPVNLGNAAHPNNNRRL